MPVTNERKEYYRREAIVVEVRQALAAHGRGEIDWVTFVGSGEPTLHSEIGWLIRQVQAMTELPVAVITNGALLYRPEVRQELMAADAVMPTVDAGTADLYRRINRPHPEATFERLVDGLVAFSNAYRGKLWPEVISSPTRYISACPRDRRPRPGSSRPTKRACCARRPSWATSRA